MSLELRPVPVQRNRKKHSTYDVHRVKQLLEQEINEYTDLFPSLAQIRQKYKLSKTMLYRYVSELCYIISKKYLEQQKELREKRIKNNCEALEKAIDELIKAGIYPSKVRIEALCNKKGTLREKETLEYWRECMRDRAYSESSNVSNIFANNNCN